MNEEEIMRILAQESLKLELRLQRYGEKKFWTYLEFLESGKGYIWKYFRKSGVFMEILGTTT
jgi:hypothetical protein